MLITGRHIAVLWHMAWWESMRNYECIFLLRLLRSDVLMPVTSAQNTFKDHKILFFTWLRRGCFIREIHYKFRIASTQPKTCTRISFALIAVRTYARWCTAYTKIRKQTHQYSKLVASTQPKTMICYKFEQLSKIFSKHGRSVYCSSLFEGTTQVVYIA